MARTEINKLLYLKEIEQKEVCEAIGKSQSYLTPRVKGRLPFTLDDAYIICDLPDTPYSEIPIIFRRSAAAGGDTNG